MSVSGAGTRTSEELVRYFAEAFAAQGIDPSDFNVLSVLRSIAEGVATLGERWEEEMLVRFASGVETATFRSFEFTLLPAAKATGVVTFARTVTTGSQTLAAGSRVRVPNTLKEYVTLDTVTMGIGVASGTSRIQAAIEGAFENTATGTITSIASPPVGALWTMTNAAAVTNGANVEDNEGRVLRFRQFVQDIHRSTADAIAHGARTAALYDIDGNVLEAVRDAEVTDQYGTARVAIWNGDATAPAASADLIVRARDVLYGYTDGVTGAHIPGYKAAGVALVVTAATILPVDVTVSLYLQDGYQMTQVAPSVREAILSVFSRQVVGSPKLRLNDLRQAIGLTRGVVDHVFSTPLADVAGGHGVIIVPGTLTVAQAA